jgi:hypothetical protein
MLRLARKSDSLLFTLSGIPFARQTKYWES